MKLHKFQCYILVLVCMLSALTLSTHAATTQINTRLLNHQAGSPRDPKNIKLNITLPESYGRTKFSADDFSIYIYPQALNIATGKRNKYKAEKVLLWQYNNQIFLDIRKPPKQRSGGEHTVYVQINKNDHVIYNTELSEKVSYEDDEVDVVLIIDSSLSMHSNDPYRNRLKAAKAFADIARSDKRIKNIGIVSFNNKSKIIADLTPVRNNRRLSKAIDSINAAGQTDIGEALTTGLNVLSNAKSRRTAAVLLTDGKNESSVYQNQHLDFARSNIPVYCIGLSNQADTNLLKKIAKDTKASFFKASTDNDLLGIYQRIASVISRREVIFSNKIPANKDKISIPVDNSINDISFMLNAGMDEVIFKLISPEGKIFDVTPSKDSSFSEIRVTKPETGLWTVQMSNRASKRELELNVTGDTSLYLDSFPPLQTGNQVFLTGTLADNGNAIENSNIQVISQRGGIKLFDDGKHSDGNAGDGIYTCKIPAENEFDLDLLLRAWGSKKVPYIRQTSAGTLKRQIIQVEEPEITYTLKSNSELTFKTAYAGEIIDSTINLDYCGLPRDLKAAFTSLKNSVYSIHSDNLRLATHKISEDNTELKVELSIPADIPSGTYTGNVKLATPETSITLPVSINITDSKLIVDKERLDLGYLEEGNKQTCNVSVCLKAANAAKLTIAATNPAFTIDYDNNHTIKPEESKNISFSILSKNYDLNEEQKENIIIKAGELQQTIELTYCIAPKGKKQQTISLAHEMSLPEVSRHMAVSSFNHEMQIPKPIVTPKLEITTTQKIGIKTQAPKLELTREAPEITVEPPKIAAPRTEQESSLLVILIIIATIALSAILLIIRKLSSKRMVRFALLSATLHLPIIALIASYIIVTGSTYTPPAKPPVTNMVIASATSENNYINQNLDTLKVMNSTTKSSIPDFNNLPTKTPIDTEIIDAAENEITANDASSTISTSVNPISFAEINSEKNEVSDVADFDFRELSIKEPSREESNESMQNIKDLQEELNSKIKPQTPLDDIFDSQTALANTNNIDSQDTNSNRTELAELIDNDVSINEEINNILRSDNIHNNISSNAPTHEIAKITTPTIMHDNKFAELDEIDLPLPDMLDHKNELSRDLNKEINQATQLKSLAQNTPLAENPEQLLTSLDKTAPIEADNGFDLVIPTEDVPENITDLDNKIFAQSAHNNDIITETTPCPRLTKNKIISDNFDDNLVEAIPGVTPDGLCMDFDVINNSLDLSRGSLKSSENKISEIPSTSPKIDDLALNRLSLDQEEAILPIKNNYEDNLLISEQKIEIPEDEISSDIDELNNQPEVIAAIDSLDLNIDKKISRLTDTKRVVVNHKSKILRNETNNSVNIIKEEKYIPKQPDIQKLSSRETFTAKNPVKIIPEIPTDNMQNLDVEDIKTDTKNTLNSNMPISKISVQSEEQVTITNSPKRLKSAITTGAELLKLPKNLTLSNSVDSAAAIDNISLHIGVLSSGNNTINSEQYENKKINFINLYNSSDIESDLLSCQLVIADKAEFNNNEINLLKDYLTSGGYLWIQNKGIPQELSTIGQIKPIAKNDQIFNSVYAINKNNILFAEELSSNSKRRVIATGCRNDEVYNPLLSNIFTAIFGNYAGSTSIEARANTEAKFNSYTWQNFSGVDKSTLGWKAPKWGNSVKIAIAPDGQGGEALMVNINSGREDITSINYIIPDYEGRRIDLSENSAIILDIYNASKKYLDVSLGLTTESQTAGWDEFETQRVTLQAGWNRNVIIPLEKFRSRRDPQGDYIHNLGSPDNCARVSLYFKNIKDGANLLIDNIKWAN